LIKHFYTKTMTIKILFTEGGIILFEIFEKEMTFHLIKLF